MKAFTFTALLATTALLVTGCAVAPAMTAQETQIQSDLHTNRYLPATREMRDAIETQELFAQAAFWSNEYDLNPGDLEAAIKLAASVRKLGNPNRAVEITQTTRALYPRDPYLVAEYAAALIAAERSMDAMEPLDEALAMTPAYARLWSLKGAALDQQERYAEAQQYYGRALQITPNDPNVLANIGFSYALSGDAPTAEQWLRRAAALPGASPSVRQNLALVLQLQGKVEEAEKMISLTRAPQSFTARPVQMPTQRSVSQQPAPSQFATPQARFSTGPQYQSASDAARAMASRQAETVRVEPAPDTTSKAAQQAMLERIARSLQTQPQPTTDPQVQPAAQGQPYQPAQRVPIQPYAASPVMAGGPAPNPDQTAPIQRRNPVRRRR